MQANSTTTINDSPKSHYIEDSRGNLYLRSLVKRFVDDTGKVTPRFTTFRCFSKKARLKLKLALREESLPCPSSSLSSKNSSAPAPSTSPA